MKSLRNYIDEKLVINKNYVNGRNHVYNYHPTTKNDLKTIIREHYRKGVYDLNDIDVSKITDFSYVFREDKHTENINFNISGWNVHNGTNFSWMFGTCKKFNSDLSGWDVHNGTSFNSMFFGCREFNADLSQWKVSKGNSFSGMFALCKNFNCDLSNWNIKKTAKTQQMFHKCGIEDKYKPKGIK